MLPMLQKHTLITAALMATLALSACGKKKEVFTPPTKQPESSGPVSGQDDTNGKLGGGLSEPKTGGEDDYNPPTTLPDPSNEDDGYTDNNNNNSGSNRPETKRPVSPPVAENRPAPEAGSNRIPDSYSPSNSENVTRGGLSKRTTGAVTADGLLYTSTSTDELLDYLRARNDRVNYETRRLNERAAGDVVSAKINVDSLTGDAIITLKIQEAGGVRVYNVAGSSESGPSNPLRVVRAGNGERTTGTRALEGTLKCVDFDGGCENMMARFKIGSSPSSAIFYVVFRDSISDLHFHLPGQYSDNPEYAQLREFAVNTIKGVKTENRIKTIRMKSWEVVNGRSSVMVSMKGYNNELLAFSGPLLAPEAGTGVNVRLARLAQDQEDSLDLITMSKPRLTYANWIGDARMIANNGLGQVRVALKMRKRGPYAQDQFAATFMRRIKPIVELSDENLGL